MSISGYNAVLFGGFPREKPQLQLLAKSTYYSQGQHVIAIQQGSPQ